jgi:esterase/lipase
MDLPIIELTLEDLEQGVDATALVENPAIQRNWMAFKEHKSYEFKTHNEEKRILAGALMVADFPMYRNMNGKEFFVKFSSETIEQLADRMVLNNKLTAFNFEHDAKKELADMHIQQFFIINTELGVNTPIGFEELPNGSLFAFVKVNNEQVWNDYVKTGIVKGFSIEGNFATKEEFSEQTFLKEFQTIINMTDKKTANTKLDELMAKAKSFFSEDYKEKEEEKKEEEVKMAEATLTDGTKVMYEGELAEGTIVLLEDGSAAPDGEHTFEDGTVISIEGGQVVAVAKPMTEQEMAIQKLTEMVTKLETENAELKSNFEKSINKVEEKFSAQIKESNKLTEDVLELVKTLVAEPTQHSFNTQAKPKSYIDGLVANLKYSQTKIK